MECQGCVICSIYSSPFLLAGTGSQLLLFDVSHVCIITSFCVSDGILVHYISPYAFINPTTSSRTFRIVVYGERRLKLFGLHLHLALTSLSPPVSATLICLHLLPTLTHQILDYCFLKDAVSFYSKARGDAQYPVFVEVLLGLSFFRPLPQ
ncbi:uncharacterized protein LOC141605048 isoform X2 [Silene latifolia]|uniref:uncharacterized protein LOC141605048 isoform X2 n=1 Tax=Silene latifolia TaxID=37657 RepID=UPI003D7716C6